MYVNENKYVMYLVVLRVSLALLYRVVIWIILHFSILWCIFREHLVLSYILLSCREYILTWVDATSRTQIHALRSSDVRT